MPNRNSRLPIWVLDRFNYDLSHFVKSAKLKLLLHNRVRFVANVVLDLALLFLLSELVRLRRNSAKRRMGIKLHGFVALY